LFENLSDWKHWPWEEIRADEKVISGKLGNNEEKVKEMKKLMEKNVSFLLLFVSSSNTIVRGSYIEVHGFPFFDVPVMLL